MLYKSIRDDDEALCNNVQDQSHMCSPASQALSATEDMLPQPEYTRRAASKALQDSSCERHGTKRRKSSLEMESILSSIVPVEESIAFPTIEWLYNDDDDEHSDALDELRSMDEPDQNVTRGVRHYASTPLLGKRSRTGGMLRSKSLELSLASLVATSVSKHELMSVASSTSLMPLFSDDTSALSAHDSIRLALKAMI